MRSLGQILDSTIDIDKACSGMEEIKEDCSYQILFATPLEKDLMEIAVKIPEPQILLHDPSKPEEVKPAVTVAVAANPLPSTNEERKPVIKSSSKPIQPADKEANESITGTD